MACCPDLDPNRPQAEPYASVLPAVRQTCGYCGCRRDEMHAEDCPAVTSWTVPPGQILTYNGKRVPEVLPAVVNPKELAGAKKPATWSVMPRWVVLGVGRIMSVGAAKYGAFNYRESSISASIYQDAMERHQQLWFDGEDNDPETGESHLFSVIASCMLLLDAQASGKLHDDRQKTGRAREMLDKLEALLVTLPLPQSKG